MGRGLQCEETVGCHSSATRGPLPPARIAGRAGRFGAPWHRDRDAAVSGDGVTVAPQRTATGAKCAALKDWSREAQWGVPRVTPAPRASSVPAPFRRVRAGAGATTTQHRAAVTLLPRPAVDGSNPRVPFCCELS